MRTRWFVAGLLVGALPALALPGARAALAPLLLLPVLPLAWVGTGLAGWVLLERRGGRGLLAQTALGAGLLHTAALPLGLLGLWSRPVLLGVIGSAGAAGLADLLLRARRPPTVHTGRAAGLLCGAAGLVAGLLLLVLVVPPMDPDALTYHLALPQLWKAEGAFLHVPTLHYSYMPLGGEIGFLLAGSLLPGAGIAAWNLGGGVSLVYGLLLAAAAGTVVAPGEAEEHGPIAGWRGPLACLLVLVLPVSLLVAGLPYNDAYLAALLLLALDRALRFAQEGSLRHALLAGLFFGFALGAKYTALLAGPALLAGALARAAGPDAQPWPRLVRGALLAGLAATAVALPWYGKTALATGNPVYPAAWGLLDGAPGGHEAWDAAAAERNAETAGHGAGLHPLRWLSAPWRLLSDPERFGALPRVGPALLLGIPFLLAALALGEPRMRAVALTALALYLTWSLTARNARYLLPCLALCMGQIAWGVDRMLRRRSPVRFALALGVPAVLLASGGLVGIAVLQGLLSPGAYLRGEESASAYLSARRPNAACLLDASRMLPEEASVLLIGETRGMYLGRRFLAGGPADPSPLLWLERRAGGGGFRRALEASEASHVLVDPFAVLEGERLHGRYRGRLAEAMALAGDLARESDPILECSTGALVYPVAPLRDAHHPRRLPASRTK